MKKSFVLWRKTTEVYMRISPLLLAGAVLLSVIMWIRPAYIRRVSGLMLFNQQAVYLFVTTAVFLAMCVSLFQVWDETVKSNFQMAYWLLLTEWEFYVYVLLKRLPWYYAFLITLFLSGGGLWKNYALAICFLTVLYVLLTLLIYLWCSAVQHRGGRFQRRKKRGHVLEKRNILYGPVHPNPELILLSWRYRYMSLEGLICKAVVLGIGIFLLGSKLTDPYCTVAYFVLFFILSCVDDNYWKREAANAVLFRNIGVSFGRYFLIHTTSGILFHSILLSVLYGLACGSIINGVIFLLGTALLVCYWNAAYLYLYFSGGEHVDMLKQLYLLVVLAVMLVPVVNLAVGLFLWGKVRKSWRRTPC